MINTIEIKPLIGLNDIEFGISVDELVTSLGEPDQIEDLSEDGDNLTIEMLNYEKLRLSCFFEGSDGLYFNSCDTENPSTIIFETKIFKLKEKEIIALFEKNGYTDFESESEEWGEIRLTFNDALVDLYFIEGELISITWGLPFGE